MSALENLSNEELAQLWQQHTAPNQQGPALNSLSDDDLKALHAQYLDPREVAMNNARTDNRSFWTKLGEGFGSKQDWKKASHTLGTELKISANAVPVAGSLIERTPEMEQYQQDHPGRAAVAKAIGTTAALGPAVAAAPEIFGAGAGQSILGRIAAGGLSNATIAGTDTLARGGTLDDARKNAEIAGGVGAAFPLVASMVTAPIKALSYAGKAIARANNPEQAAIDSVADKMAEAKINPADLQRQFSPQPSSNLQGRGFDQSQMSDIVSRGLKGETASAIAKDYGLHPNTVSKYLNDYRQANPTPLNVLDMSKIAAGEGSAQPLSRLGRAAANISPQPEMMQDLLTRQLNQPGRATNIINQAAAGGDFEATQAAMADKLRQESATAYKAFEAEPALATKDLNDLIEDPLFARAVQAARAQSRASAIAENQALIKAGKQPNVMVPSLESGGPGELFSPQMLDKIQRQLRLAGENFSDPNAAAHAKDLRSIFLDRIEQYYPTFKGIRANYASGMGEQEALTAGENLAPRLGAPARDTLQQFDKMTPAQQDLFRMGFARKLMDMVGNRRESADVVQQFSSPAVREMIQRVYPEPVADQLIQRLSNEGVTTGTIRDLFGNSTTARQILDQNKLMQGAQTAADAITGRWGKVLENLSNRLTEQIGKKSSGEILKVLSTSDPAQVLGILNRLAQSAKSSAERQAYVMAIRQGRNYLPLLAGQYAAHRYGAQAAE